MGPYNLPKEAQDLLAGASVLEVRELCVRALRDKRASAATQINLSSDICGRLVPPLLERKGRPVPAHANMIGASIFQHLEQPWAAPVAEFIVWFTRAGFAWALGGDQNRFPYNVYLTAAGEAFLDASDDHPILPGFAVRLATRCPGLPDGVLSLFADARSCLDAGQVRPAVVVLGVAYESATESVAEALVGAGLLPADVADAGAARRLAAVRSAAEKILPKATPQERDDRFATLSACDFADALRRRRNDAAHTKPTYGFEDRAEGEEVLVSAGRHLPNLWRCATTAKGAGGSR